MPSLSPQQVLYAALLAGCIALLAGVLRLLTYSGALAAFAIGFFVFAAGGVPFAIPLLVFFISSSFLSRLGRARKAKAAVHYEKGSRRDVWQVIANGALPAVLAILYHLSHHLRDTALLYMASLAAVNADTWATEIGGLWSGRPRLVTTLRKVDPGTSGAVSVLGLVGSAAGAAAITITAWLVWPMLPVELHWWRIDLPELIAVTWAGFLAAYADSILGASIQAQYRCTRCGNTTERRQHCERQSKRVRGLDWVNNDLVNVWASALGVLFAWVILRYYAYPG